MIYLSGAVRPELFQAHPDIGFMLTPNMGNKPDLTSTVWGADTGCYSPSGDKGFDLDRYVAFLRINGKYRITNLFATAPDVVGSATETWERSRTVLPIIRELGYHASLVAQCGIHVEEIVWDAFDVLFIGGCTPFKLSIETARLCERARSLGKRVHMGRVNSLRRMYIAAAMGCHSVDGTYVKFGPSVNIPKLLQWMSKIAENPVMPLP